MTDGMIKEFRGKYRFLSNFFPCPVEMDRRLYRTVEHAYQAAKTILNEERSQIQACMNPGQAKKLGRKVTLSSNWEYVKVKVMADLVRQKFSKEPFRTWLIATGAEEIQEGNTWGDSYWGINLRTGQGENMLGRILMMIREELK